MGLSAPPAPASARGPSRRGWRVVVALCLCSSLFWLAAGRVQAQDAYRIAAGDEVRLDVLDDGLDVYPLKVSPEGDVPLPFVGTFQVAGQTLSAARDAIAALYVEQGIFVTPLIDLSVASFRPVSVLGDVREPGVYDYLADLTVEQAVGLAGGLRTSAVDEEGRSLQRAALRAEFAANQGSMAQEAVAGARLQAQLAGADHLRPEDVPGSLEGVAPLIATLIEQEDAILAAERENFLAQVSIVERSIEEARAEIAFTEEQIATQTDQVASYGGELESSVELSEQGLMAAPALARLQRQVADEERTLLQLRTSLAGTRRLLAGLEGERQRLAFEREQGWREERVASEVRLAQLGAERRSILERLRLLDDWSLGAANAEAETEVTFLVRRRGPDGAEATVTAGMSDALGPGDVLIVDAGAPPVPDRPGRGGSS